MALKPLEINVDPDENLKQQLAMASHIVWAAEEGRELKPTDAHELAELVISLHDHPVRFPADMEQTPEYNRTGRQHAAYAGLAASGMTVVFDNMMDGTACVTGCRLYPDIFKRALAQYSSIADAVKGNAAGKTKILFPGIPADMPCYAQHYLFSNILNGAGQIHIPLGQQRLGLSRWAAKQIFKFIAGHGQPGTVVKVIHIQLKGTIFL